MPRIARVCAIDYPHHVTQRGNNRESAFFDNEDRAFYLKALSKYSQQWEFDIWAYCLMTNHVHILLVPVRVGLVQKAEDYKWSSCKTHVSGFKDSILTGKGWLEEDNVQAYREFLRNDDKEIEKSIRNATTTGRPLGRVSFIQLLEKELGRSLLPKKAGRPRKKEGG